MSNYSSDDFLLANVLLRKFPIAEPRHTHSMFSGIMMGEQSNFDAETFSRLSQKVMTGGGANARKILLENDFLDCIDIRYPTDKLTEKGKIAKQKGSIEEYNKWETEEIKNQTKLSFPQKNWLLVAILTGAFGFFSDLIVGIILDSKKQEEKQSTKQSSKLPQVVIDTVYIYLPDSSLKRPSKPNN